MKPTVAVPPPPFFSDQLFSEMEPAIDDNTDESVPAQENGKSRPELTDHGVQHGGPQRFEQLLALHRECLKFSASAADQLAQICFQHLLPILKAQFPKADRVIVNDAVIDALMDYLTFPNKFDPARGKSLIGYLKMGARCLLSKQILSDKRRRKRECVYCLELPQFSESDESSQRKKAVKQGEWQEAIIEVRKSLRPADQGVLDLWLGGEHRTNRFAEVLRVGGCTNDEQRRHVKRAKDRLRKKIQRKLQVFGQMQAGD